MAPFQKVKNNNRFISRNSKTFLVLKPITVILVLELISCSTQQETQKRLDKEIDSLCAVRAKVKALKLGAAGATAQEEAK